MENKAAESPSLRQKLERCLKIAMSREDLECQIPHIVLALADVMRDSTYHSTLMEMWCNYFLKRNEPKADGRLAIIGSTIGSDESKIIDMVLNVRNHDENFAATVIEANREWLDTVDEWHDFMLGWLQGAGYEVEEVEYETIWCSENKGTGKEIV